MVGVLKDLAKRVVNLEIAKKLRKMNYNNSSLFVYNKEQIINPEVVKKYGNLSDDGYFDLTIDGGGELEWNYVYMYPYTLMTINEAIRMPYDLIFAPTLLDVTDWLRTEHNIIIELKPYLDCNSNLQYYSYVYKFENDKLIMLDYSFTRETNCNTYEELLAKTIEEIIDKYLYKYDKD
jgi:hypothetical protein